MVSRVRDRGRWEAGRQRPSSTVEDWYFVREVGAGSDEAVALSSPIWVTMGRAGATTDRPGDAAAADLAGAAGAARDDAALAITLPAGGGPSQAEIRRHPNLNRAGDPYPAFRSPTRPLPLAVRPPRSWFGQSERERGSRGSRRRTGRPSARSP